MSAELQRPLGGKILTRSFVLLLALVCASAGIVVWRLLFGLGSVTAMSDGYPWGIWKPLNVVTYTGIAAGAYAVGMLTYVFNRGRYHPLLRSAVMAAAMGYTLAGTSVLVDLGRWWNLWVLFWPGVYNLNSVLLEVAICVLAYTVVLWVEVFPPVLEEVCEVPGTPFRRLLCRLQPVLNKALPFIIALAILLPTMHQSSLGGLYLVAVTKLHPLWFTPWLPALFLVSCLTMGYGSVVLIEMLTSWAFPRQTDYGALARIGIVAIWAAVLFLGLRLGDLVLSGRLAKAWDMPRAGFFFSFLGVEVAIYVAAIVLLATQRLRRNPGLLFAGSVLLVVGGSLYRFDTYLTGYLPRAGWHYFPSVLEILNSIGFAAAGVAVYIAMAKRFPLLSGVVADRPAGGAAPAKPAPRTVAAGSSR